MIPRDTQRPHNPDQLRERIDRGETGDKVDFPDSAAAPLGTDDEAAGRAAKTMKAEPRPRDVPPPIEAGSRKPSLGGRTMVLVLSVAVIAALAMAASVLI